VNKEQKMLSSNSMLGYLDNPDYLSYVNEGDKFILHRLAT
jgi:hypothetical protein